MQLQLEINQNAEGVERANNGAILAGGAIMVTPPVGENYWLMRVRVSPDQAIIGFPKFGTIGIGFAKEDFDWNTNLPYRCDTDVIWNHIKKNKGSKTIPKSRCVEAIRLIQAEAHRIRGTDSVKDKIP